jgi:hypothetical protein
VNGPELDPEKIQALPEPGEVLLVAREAIQRLDKDDAESPVPGRIHHAHQAIAAKKRTDKKLRDFEERSFLVEKKLAVTSGNCGKNGDV